MDDGYVLQQKQEEEGGWARRLALTLSSGLPPCLELRQAERWFGIGLVSRRRPGLEFGTVPDCWSGASQAFLVSDGKRTLGSYLKDRRRLDGAFIRQLRLHCPRGAKKQGVDGWRASCFPSHTHIYNVLL